jgi:pimeloyl-ACP methyl ester carboxylesterase
LAWSLSTRSTPWRPPERFAPRLADRFAVLAFDFRGYSSRNPQPASHIERDVVAAAAELGRL